MMKHEFEALSGFKVSDEDYKNIIEPMYMATALDKADFVACLDKKRFALPTKAQLKKAMRKEAEHLADICGHRSDYESEQRLEKLCHQYLKIVYGIDWAKDIKAFAYCLREYEFPLIGRGCTYPKTAVFGYGNTEFERFDLVK